MHSGASIPTKRLLQWAGGLLFLAACYFPVFFHLDTPPTPTWDESLFAMRAYYAAEFGAYLPNFDHFPGITYYRNLKPPFGTVFQGLSFRLLGVSELTLRLPVALFVLATVFFLYFWTKQLTGHRWTGRLTSLILLTSTGYVAPHVARTGDHDAILAFLMTAQLWAVWRWLEEVPQGGSKDFPPPFPRRRGKGTPLEGRALGFLVLLLLLAFLTKSVVGFFFVPGMVLYTIYRRRLEPVLQQRFTWLALLAVALGVAGYYAIMERTFPGFVGAVQDTVLGRYVVERNDQGQPFGYYFVEIARRRFAPWLYVLPLNLLFWRQATPAIRQISVLVWAAVLPYLLIISFSETKLGWYDAAVYPALALLTGISLFQLYQWLREKRPQQAGWIMGLAVAALLAPAYYRTVMNLYHYRLGNPHDQYAYLMRKLQRTRPDLRNYTVYCHPFNGQVAFYTQWYNDKKDYNIRVALNLTEGDFREGDHVLVCEADKQRNLESAGWRLEPVDGWFDCQLYVLRE